VSWFGLAPGRGARERTLPRATVVRDHAGAVALAERGLTVLGEVAGVDGLRDADEPFVRDIHRALVDGITEVHALAGTDAVDGERLDQFLPGQCGSIDIAADGSAWVLSDRDEGKALYVITPEAWVASE
jgi:hypothetical protein